MNARRWILLVEDNEDDVMLLRDILPRARFPVSWVRTGAEAIERVREGDVDLVVVDYGLPDTNALLLLDEVHKIRPSLPVIVLTGRDDEALSLAATQKGAAAFLLKDEGAERIRGVIESVLRDTIIRIDESAGARAEHLYRTLVSNLQEGVILLDADGVITFSNDSAGKICGVATTDLLGRRLEDLVDETARGRLAKNETGRFEGRVRSPEGAEVPALFSVAPVPESGRSETRLVVISGIEEIVRSREVIRTRMADLERLQRFFVDREKRVIELKSLLREYERRLGIESPGLSSATRSEMERRLAQARTDGQK